MADDEDFVGLHDDSKKFWMPIKEVQDWLLSMIGPKDKVLEIGPGAIPFPRSDVFVDQDSNLGIPVTKRDMNREGLPFFDKEFDFVYCRHVLEDMWNPFNLLTEMERVGKAGYLETPSPIAEMCRGVDGGCPQYRGYHHHRFFLWTDEKNLNVMSKFPLVEFASDKADLSELLKASPAWWNTYCYWKDTIPWVHHDGIISKDHGRGYIDKINQACEASFDATKGVLGPLMGAT